MEYILYEETEHIGMITINRPKALNALNTQLLNELFSTLEQIDTNKIRVLIITGAGEKSFVAGADISEMRELTSAQAIEFSKFGNKIMRKIEEFPVPIIAAINGFALGGGCELALSCDIRLASETAVFGFPEVTLGIPPGYGGLQRAARIVGMGNAKILAFTAERIKANEACKLGLVDRVYPKDELIEQAKIMAKKVANNAPVAVRGCKEILNSSVGLTLDEADCLELEKFGECFDTEDRINAMGAFLKLNDPTPFTGK